MTENYTDDFAGLTPPLDARRGALYSYLYHHDGVTTSHDRGEALVAEIDARGHEATREAVKLVAASLGFRMGGEGRFTVVLTPGVHDPYTFKWATEKAGP